MAGGRVTPAAQGAGGFRLSFWSLLSLLLLFAVLYAAAGGAARAMNGPVWDPLWQAILVGLLVGWLSGAAGFRLGWAVPAAVILGAGFAFFTGGGLARPAAAILVELNRLAMSLAGGLDPVRLDFAPLLRAADQFLTAVLVVAGRLKFWLASWGSGSLRFDPVATTVIWGALIWMVSLWGGWMLAVRRSALLAALPGLLLCVIPITYTNTRYDGLYWLLAMSLLFIASVQQEGRQRAWLAGAVAFPADIGWEIGKRTALAAAGIVLLSALVPSVSVQQLREMMRPDPAAAPEQGSSLADSLGLAQAPEAADPLDDVRRPGLPREHLIGSGPELSEQVVMQVELEGLSEGPAGAGAPPLYWRSLTYDVYTGRGWRSSESNEEGYEAGFPARARSAPHAVLVGQRVEMVAERGVVLFSAGELVSVDRSYTIARRHAADVFAATAEHDGQYSALSLLISPDEAALRAAGQAYPQWVRERYLRLPADLPGRVRSLALELTATERTAYDRAVAIERYLRRIPYTLDVDRPPLHRDVVDYFLFDERQGYCDYYASAMSVLARAAGVPARLATGYASGEFDESSGSYRVTEAQAHSWVEIYFPGIGWVPFEPTAAQPSLERAALSQAAADTSLRDSSLFSAETSQASEATYWPWLLLPLLVLPAIGSVWLWDLVRLRRMSPAAATAEINRRLRRLAARLGLELDPGATPAEVGSTLAEFLSEEAHRARRTNPLARGLMRDVDHLLDWVEAVQFEPAGQRTPPQAARWPQAWLRAHLLALLLRRAPRWPNTYGGNT